MGNEKDTLLPAEKESSHTGTTDREEENTGSSSLNNGKQNGQASRLIAAGLVATVVLSIVAVLVTGIFQVTSRWMKTCPTDLPVNDPAPVLWERIVSPEVKTQSSGVPAQLLEQTKLK